ncbi:immunity protein Tsi6 family protein [Enterobacter sp. PI-10]|uniref:immunity protein Tsi6 family protein n=2 Tax=Enterobacteriaceae TaxID=543 RepID=UPI002301600D|nr:immunity protein Tsi6 family protein [Enterobacter sp. PI-10]MDA5606869.1 immunity protein Tsi6 family protein [Enterobacter sp. PI-10]
MPISVRSAGKSGIRKFTPPRRQWLRQSTLSKILSSERIYLSWIMSKENYTALDYINDAIDAINNRLEQNPTFSLYVMAKNQLDYIKSILTGAEKDKSKLHTLNLGVLASKEFDTTDAELAQHLSNANYIASQMGQGLKVILPHEQDVEYLKRQKRYRK